MASGSLTVGTLQIDVGAAKALQKRSSLLAVGIKKVKGDFEIGEVVEITDNQGVMLAVARTKVSSAELTENLKTLNFEVANANDIVLI